MNPITALRARRLAARARALQTARDELLRLNVAGGLAVDPDVWKDFVAHHQTADGLRRALHADVADVQPSDRLDHILDEARRRRSWLIAIAAGVALGLILAGILIAVHGMPEDEPQPTPTFSNRPLET